MLQWLRTVISFVTKNFHFTEEQILDNMGKGTFWKFSRKSSRFKEESYEIVKKNWKICVDF
jgi:hypothetical protein